MNKIAFTKMQGCGNDYIYVDTMQYHIADPHAAAIEWSDRHKGIGSDGLVLIGRSPVPEADFSMRIFNADGSEAQMCGNASRCIGKYLYERKLTDKQDIRLLTPSGIRNLKLHMKGGVVESVTVDMGEPNVADDMHLAKNSATKHFAPTDDLPTGVFVSMGNPHYVIFTDDVNQVETKGANLECHPAFPMHCNIEFAYMMPDGRIRVRVWERGSGLTMACGTGACAVAVAAAHTGRSGRESEIIMDGGILHIQWREQDNHVYKTGPAAFVYDGEILPL